MGQHRTKEQKERSRLRLAQSQPASLSSSPTATSTVTLANTTAVPARQLDQLWSIDTEWLKRDWLKTLVVTALTLGLLFISWWRLRAA